MRWFTLWPLAALCSLSLSAAAPAPVLVERAIQLLHQGKPEVASKVVTHVDVYDGKGAFLGSLETVDALASWGKDGKPVRKEVSSHQQGSPGFTMNLSLHLEDSPAEALDGFDTWEDAGPTELQGKATVRFSPGGGGAWVPRSATLDQAGRVMFWSRHLVVVTTYQAWVPRP